MGGEEGWIQIHPSEYMDITFYKCNSPGNYVTKNLAGAVTMSGELREESSVIDPIMIVEYVNLAQYNYLYIPEFKRFYFIRNIDSVRNGLWRVHGHVDVLTTYRTEILAHQAIVTKIDDSDRSNLMIDDGEWVCENRKVNRIIEFPNGLRESGQYILIAAGA